MKHALARLPILLAMIAALTIAAIAFGQDVAPSVDPNIWRETIIPSILAAIVTVGGAAITWAAAKAAAWLTARAEATKNELLRGVLIAVATQAGVAVQHVAQKAVDKLRAASADGKLHPSDAAAALQAAVTETWSGIGQQARDLLTKEHGGTDKALKVIETFVEAKVREAGVTTPTSTVPVTNDAEALRELAIARERLRSISGGVG